MLFRSPRTGLWAIESIAAGKHRVTAENLEAGIIELRTLAEGTDPARLIGAVRGQTPN